MKNGYDFFIDGMLLPITPPSLDITVGSTNETLTLINEGEINVLKSPSLIEISFEARFPMRDYPYSKQVKSFQEYYDKIKELKSKKKFFQSLNLLYVQPLMGEGQVFPMPRTHRPQKNFMKFLIKN